MTQKFFDFDISKHCFLLEGCSRLHHDCVSKFPFPVSNTAMPTTPSSHVLL